MSLPNPTRLGQTTAASISVTYAANSLLIVYALGGTISDTAGLTWTQRAVSSDTLFSIHTAPTGGSGGTTTITAGGGAAYLIVDQASGSGGGAPKFVQVSPVSNGGTPRTVTLGSSPSASNLLVGCIMCSAGPNSSSVTPPTGWTAVSATNVRNSSSFSAGSAYQQSPSSTTSSWVIDYSGFSGAGVNAAVMELRDPAVGIAGTASGVATVSGTATRRETAAGVSTGGSAVSGSLNYRAALTGQALGAAAVSGQAGVSYALSAAAHGVAAAQGTLLAQRPIAGTSHGAASAQGALISVDSLSGTSHGFGTVTADLLREILMTGVASGHGTVTAQLVVTYGLSALLVGDAHASGSLRARYALAQIIVAAAHVQATLFDTKVLVPTVVHGKATVTALLRRDRGLAGISRGVATIVAPLSTPTIITTFLHGDRVRSGKLARVELESELYGIHGTRTRVGTTQAFAGDVSATRSHGSRERSGTMQATATDVTASNVNLAGARERSTSLVATGENPAPHVHGLRTRVGTLMARVVNAVFAHLDSSRPARGGRMASAQLVHLPPPNDEITGAITLAPFGGTLSFETTYASANAFEPSQPNGLGFVPAKRSLWYLYTAPYDGVFRISTGPINNGVDPYMATWLGTFSSPALDDRDYADLHVVAAVEAVPSYDPDGAASFISEPMHAGDFVWVRVDSPSDVRYDDVAGTNNEYGVGPGLLTWDFVAPGGTGQPGQADAEGIITPGNLVISMGNLLPNSTVVFSVDSADPVDAVDSVDVGDIGALTDMTVWLPIGLSPGRHTLYGIVGTEPAFTISFLVLGEPADDGEDSDVDPVLIPRSGVQRWIFQDPTGVASPAGDASYIVPINPNKMNTPFRDKEITTGTLVGAAGNAIVWEGDGELPVWTFSGTILSGDTGDPTSHLSMLRYYESLQYPIYIIDHFNRAWTVYIQSFDAVPAGLQHHRNRHTYTMTAIALKPPVQLS